MLSHLLDTLIPARARRLARVRARLDRYCVVR